MRCPFCSGNNIVTLSPGFYECRSTRTTRVGGPGLTDPTKGPPVIETFSTCGHRWQEGSGQSGAVCACGIFAIGTCQSCHRPVCGRHSELRESQLLCGNCFHRDNAAALARSADAQATAARERADEYEAALEKWRAESLRQLDGAEPIEQLVRAAAGLCSTLGFGVVSAGHLGWPEPAHRLFPQWFGPEGEPKWKVHDVAAWFAKRASRSTDLVSVYTQGFFGIKQRQVPGWYLSAAATTGRSPRDSTIYIYDDLTILAGGSVQKRGDNLSRQDSTNISVGGLKWMCERLRLPPIPEPPRKPRS